MGYAEAMPSILIIHLDNNDANLLAVICPAVLTPAPYF